MIDLLADLDDPEAAWRAGPYRLLIEAAVGVAREEVGDPDDMAPAMRARFDLMRRSLEAPSEVPDTGFAAQVISLVKLIEYRFRDLPACIERFYRGESFLDREAAYKLLGENFGELYLRAVNQLIEDGIYPVVRPRGCDYSPARFARLRAARQAFSDVQRETSRQRYWRRLMETTRQFATEYAVGIDDDFLPRLQAEWERSEALHALERAY